MREVIAKRGTDVTPDRYLVSRIKMKPKKQQSGWQAVLQKFSTALLPGVVGPAERH